MIKILEMDNMKILITSDWYKPVINGVVMSIVNLEKELALRGHEVRILTLSPTIHSYTENNIVYIGSVNADKIYPQARIRVKTVHIPIIKELIEWKPDIVHSQCEFSTFSLGRKIAKESCAPFIHTYHTVYENYTHYFSPSVRIGKKIAAGFTRSVLKKADAIVAPSEKVHDLLDAYDIHLPTYVIPTGINTEKFSKNPQICWVRQKKQEYGIPDKNLVLLYIGRLAKEKNIEELLFCMSLLAGKGITLMMIGDGPYRSRLEQITTELGVKPYIIWGGIVPPEQIGAYYHLGDVFVNASTSETQGLTYFEALSAALPMLCHKDDCLTGVIENGKNGWQYNNPEEFVRYALMFRDQFHLRSSMSEHAARKAKEFSIDVFADQLEALYFQIT